MDIGKVTTGAQLFVTRETDVFRVEIFFRKRHQRWGNQERVVG